MSKKLHGTAAYLNKVFTKKGGKDNYENEIYSTGHSDGFFEGIFFCVIVSKGISFASDLIKLLKNERSH